MTTITIAKAKQDYEIDFASLPKASQDYLINYGIKQALNDVHASINAKAADKDGNLLYANEDAIATATHEAVQERIAKLQAGTMSERASSKEPADPVAAMELRIAKEMVAVAVKAAGKKLKQLLPAQMESLIKQAQEKYGKEIKAEAKKRLAANEKIELEL